MRSWPFSRGFSIIHCDRQRSGLDTYSHICCATSNCFHSVLPAIMVDKHSAEKPGPLGDVAVHAMGQPAHCISAGDVLDQLQSDAQSGLSEDEVSKRKQAYGANALEGSGGVGPIRILMNQVLNALTMVCRWQSHEPDL